MKAALAIKEVMRIKDVRPAVLCNRLGIKSNVLSERVKQNNISVAKLNEMLKAMDYKVVILPRDARLPDGGIEVE